MKEELQLNLVQKYPKILKDFRGDPKHTCMAWGFECDDGWYNLLDKCMKKMQHFCDLCFYRSGTQVQVVANQIKEKFGTLRFYISVYEADEVENSIIDDIISQAENESAHTCEITGERGELCHKGGWYKTLCRNQAKQLGYKACNKKIESYWNSKDAEESDI